jgi:hypothetical protein
MCPPSSPTPCPSEHPCSTPSPNYVPSTSPSPRHKDFPPLHSPGADLMLSHAQQRKAKGKGKGAQLRMHAMSRLTYNSALRSHIYPRDLCAPRQAVQWTVQMGRWCGKARGAPSPAPSASPVTSVVPSSETRSSSAHPRLLGIGSGVMLKAFFCAPCLELLRGRTTAGDKQFWDELPALFISRPGTRFGDESTSPLA